MTTNLRWAFILVFILFILDQVLKFWVKLNFVIGDYISILSWFEIKFVENNGMAFGLELGGEIGKIILSIIRIITVFFIFRWLFFVATNKSLFNQPLFLALIFIGAGALGNIVDGFCYGIIFSDSWDKLAVFMPTNGGYSSWWLGKVVDMLYFPIIDTSIPIWVPFFGGANITFFDYIFNLADAYVFTGFSIMLLWNKTCFKK